MNLVGLRVTVVSRIYLPEPAAASFRLGALVQQLTSLGINALVMTSCAPLSGADQDLAPGRVKRWPVLRDSSGYVRGYVQYLSFDVPVFFRLLMSRRADVVVVEPPPTTGFVVRIVSALARTPYVYYAADVWSDAAASTGSPEIVVRLLRAVESWVVRGAAGVLAVNELLADRVIELAPSARVQVVGNGVDTQVFCPQGAVAPGAPYAIYAGTTSEWQGADIFLRALAQVRERSPNARLVFLGAGSAWESLKVLAQELGVQDSVDFVDSVPARVAAEWLRGARLAMVSMKPDQGYDFALPTKVLAALASGTPVLYAGVGPAVELIESAPAELLAGHAVPYLVDAVAAELTSAFCEPMLPDEHRQDLAAWAAGTVSLSAVAERAARVVIEAAHARKT